MARKKNIELLPEMVDWFRATHPELDTLLIHVPKANATLSKRGVPYGCADLVLLVPNNDYISLCVQVFEPPRLTEQQNRWRIIAENNGNKCVVVKDLLGFVKAVGNYLEETPYA